MKIMQSLASLGQGKGTFSASLFFGYSSTEMWLSLFVPVQPTQSSVFVFRWQKRSHTQMCQSPPELVYAQTTAFSSPGSSSTVKPKEPHENTRWAWHCFSAAALIWSIKSSGTCNPLLLFKCLFSAFVWDKVQPRVVNSALIACPLNHSLLPATVIESR